jgi:hypothetical protein
MGEGRGEGGRKEASQGDRNASVISGKMRKINEKNEKLDFFLGAWGITLFWTLTATLPC